MFSNTVTLALDKLSPSHTCVGTRGLTRGHTWSRGSPWQCPSTHSFLHGTVPATVTPALLGHIPHPARQERLRPHAPPRLSTSPALCPATAVDSSVLAR